MDISALTPASGVETSRQQAGIWRFFAYSGIGIFMFFIPIAPRGTNTMALNHVVTWWAGISW